MSKLGKKVLLVKRGEMDLDDALKDEYRSQKLVVWGIRFIGFFFIYLSTTCISQLLTIICKYS